MVYTEKETKLREQVIKVKDSIKSSKKLIQLEGCLSLISNLCVMYKDNRKIVEIRSYLMGYYDFKFETL
jgi:hypothetical protein